MPRCCALHHCQPAAGPATRLLVVLPLAQAFPPFGHPGAGNYKSRTSNRRRLVRNPRWRHHGIIQDALEGTLSTILGVGHRPPTLSKPHFTLVGRHPGRTPPKPTAFAAECALVRHSVSFLETKANIFGAQLCSRHARRVDSSPPRHCTP